MSHFLKALSSKKALYTDASTSSTTALHVRVLGISLFPRNMLCFTHTMPSVPGRGCWLSIFLISHHYISFCRSQLIWNNLPGKINTYQICVFPGGRLQVNDSCWRSTGVRGTFMHHTGAWIYLLLLLSLIVIPRPMCEVGWCCARPVLKTSPRGKWVLLEIDFEVFSFLEMWQL